MSKVLVKMSYDMNDADYIYGIHAMEDSKWQAIWKAYEKAGQVSVYSNNDETTRTFKQLKSYFDVVDITDEEYNFLKVSKLIGFGEPLPTIYLEDEDIEIEFDEDDYSLLCYNEEKEEWVKYEED